VRAALRLLVALLLSGCSNHGESGSAKPKLQPSSLALPADDPYKLKFRAIREADWVQNPAPPNNAPSDHGSMPAGTVVRAVRWPQLPTSWHQVLYEIPPLNIGDPPTHRFVYIHPDDFQQDPSTIDVLEWQLKTVKKGDCTLDHGWFRLYRDGSWSADFVLRSAVGGDVWHMQFNFADNNGARFSTGQTSVIDVAIPKGNQDYRFTADHREAGGGRDQIFERISRLLASSSC
jgi:hypothetical protein